MKQYVSQSFALSYYIAVEDNLFWLLVFIAMLFGALSEVANLTSSIAVEKNWVKVITGTDKQVLVVFSYHIV